MNKKKSKRMHRILVTIIILIIISLSFYFLSETITKYVGFLVFDEVKEESFSECLNSKKIFLIINGEDSTQAIQNIALHEYLNHIEIFNCARNNEICDSIGIFSFPTWIIENKVITGDITREHLITFSGCQF